MTARADLPPVVQADLGRGHPTARPAGPRRRRGGAPLPVRPNRMSCAPSRGWPDGTPFPTSFYRPTALALTGALSTLESQGVMREMNDRLEADPASPLPRRVYRRTPRLPRSAVPQLGDVPEVAGVSAGGMPARVKCLHVLVAHSLGAGTGVRPAGRRGPRPMLDPRASVTRASADAPDASDAPDAPEGGRRVMSDGIRPRVAAIDGLAPTRCACSSPTSAPTAG